MTSRSEPVWVRIGFVRRAHGVRGEVEIETFDPQSDALSKGVVVRFSEGAIRRVLAVRTGGAGVLVAFDEVATRNDAEALQGQTIEVERGALPKPKKGEDYIVDLIGFAVETTGGAAVGELVDARAGGGPGLLVVKGPEKEHLIPAAPEIVVRIDHARKTIVIDPPEGLLEL